MTRPGAPESEPEVLTEPPKEPVETDLQVLDRLLDRGLDLDGDARERLILAECPQHLQAKLRRLLAAEALGSPLDSGVPATVMTAVLDETSIEPLERGTRIGAWEVVDILGRGGMGEVYRARRADGAFEREVALKVALVRHRDDEARQRLDQERQILARLVHPAIAGLLDGGVTAGGRSWFAMELVDGEPLIAACDRRRLSIQDRLSLFLPILAAVETAHRQLVVHRDLKPNNVLLTVDGRAKLLDFGIAGVLGADGAAAEATAWLSPDYASPEMVGASAVGPASDIYQLGVLLYELVVGAVPRPLSAIPRDEWAGLLRGASPVDPLGHYHGLPAATRAAVAQHRALAPAKLEGILGGDLASVLRRATAVDQALRYGSVEALGEDIESFLAGRPVAAKRGGAGYRVAKFLGRHPWAATASTLAVLTLGGVLVTSTVRLAAERRAAEAEALRAGAVATFLADLFRAGDPLRRGGPEPRVRDLLDRGAERLATQLDAAPEVRETMQLVLGRAYLGLGDTNSALPLLEDVLAGRTARLGAQASQLSEVWLVLAETARIDRRLERAARAIDQAAHLAGDPISRGQAALERARIQRDRGDHDGAIGSAAIAREVLGAEISAELRYQLEAVEGSVFFDRASHVAAAISLRRAVEAARSAPGMEPQLATALGLLAGSELYLGHPVRARSALEEALEILDRRVGPHHPETNLVRTNLAMVLAELGESDSALALARQAEEEARSLRDPIAEVRSTIARGLALMASGESLEEGEQVVAPAAAVLGSRLGPAAVARVWTEVGDALWRGGRRADAVLWWHRAWEATAGSDSGGRLLDFGWREARVAIDRAEQLIARLRASATPEAFAGDSAALVFLDLVELRLRAHTDAELWGAIDWAELQRRIAQVETLDPRGAEDLRAELGELRAAGVVVEELAQPHPRTAP